MLNNLTVIIEVCEVKQSSAPETIGLEKLKSKSILRLNIIRWWVFGSAI